MNNPAFILLFWRDETVELLWFYVRLFAVQFTVASLRKTH